MHVYACIILHLYMYIRSERRSMFSIGFMCVVILVAQGQRDRFFLLFKGKLTRCESPLYLQRNLWLREREETL